MLKLRVGGINGAGGATSAGQRDRMEHVTSRLADQDDQLGDASRTLAETEEIAASILGSCPYTFDYSLYMKQASI